MNRRTFLQALAALLPGAAVLPKKESHWKDNLPVLDGVRWSARELIESEIPIDSVGCHLVDSSSSLVQGVFLDGRAHFGSRIYVEDILSIELIATRDATNVMVRDSWLFADDVTFPCVTGNEVLLAVSLKFRTGENPIIAFPWFHGLPLTPNGGHIHLQWPREGIVKLA